MIQYKFRDDSNKEFDSTYLLPDVSPDVILTFFLIMTAIINPNVNVMQALYICQLNL